MSLPQLNILQTRWIRSNFNTLIAVTLHANPWYCDCGMQSALAELDNDKDTLFLWKRVLGAENSQPRCSDDHEHGGTELLDGVLVDRLKGCRMSAPKITRITNDLTTPQLGRFLLVENSQ